MLNWCMVHSSISITSIDLSEIRARVDKTLMDGLHMSTICQLKIVQSY